MARLSRPTARAPPIIRQKRTRGGAARQARGGPPLLLVDGRHEALAALAAPVREHLATTCGGHTGAEAVRARAADIVGLVGALHGAPRFRRRKRAPDGPPVKWWRPGICWYRPGGAVFYSQARMIRFEWQPPSLFGKWTRSAIAAGLGLGLVLLPQRADAQQQTFHLDRLEVPGAPDDGVVLFRPVTRPQSIFYAQLGLGLSINPLRTRDITNYEPALRGSATNVITDQFSTYMSAGFELFDRLTVGATFPVAWRSPERDKAFGVQLSVRTPTGNGSSTNFGGDGSASALPMVTGEWTPRHLLPTFVGNLGIDFRPDNSVNNPTGIGAGPVQGLGIGDELRWAIGAVIPFRGGALRLTGTIFGQIGLTSDNITGPTFFTMQNTPIEWNVEGRMKLPIEGGRWFASASGGTLLLPGYGAPDLRIVALVGTYLPIEDTDARSPPARDRVRESI